MDIQKKEKLIEALREETEANSKAIEKYLDALVIKRNRTSLMMNSFMHNVVDIENSV